MHGFSIVGRFSMRIGLHGQQVGRLELRTIFSRDAGERKLMIEERNLFWENDIQAWKNTRVSIPYCTGKLCKVEGNSVERSK
jgi:hypothetical protein